MSRLLTHLDEVRGQGPLTVDLASLLRAVRADQILVIREILAVVPSALVLMEDGDGVNPGFGVLHNVIMFNARKVGSLILNAPQIRRQLIGAPSGLDQFTPLHVALGPYWVSQLLMHGAPINKKNAMGHTPLLHFTLEIARSACAEPRNLRDHEFRAIAVFETFREFAGHGSYSSIHFRDLLNTSGEAGYCIGIAHATVLTRSLRIVKFFMTHGAPFEKQDAEGRTALGYALAINDEAMVRYLLSMGVCPSTTDVRGILFKGTFQLYAEFYNPRFTSSMRRLHREANELVLLDRPALRPGQGRMGFVRTSSNQYLLTPRLHRALQRCLAEECPDDVKLSLAEALVVSSFVQKQKGYTDEVEQVFPISEVLNPMERAWSALDRGTPDDDQEIYSSSMSDNAEALGDSDVEETSTTDKTLPASVIETAVPLGVEKPCTGSSCDDALLARKPESICAIPTSEMPGDEQDNAVAGHPDTIEQIEKTGTDDSDIENTPRSGNVSPDRQTPRPGAGMVPRSTSSGLSCPPVRVVARHQRRIAAVDNDGCEGEEEEERPLSSCTAILNEAQDAMFNSPPPNARSSSRPIGRGTFQSPSSKLPQSNLTKRDLESTNFEAKPSNGKFFHFSWEEAASPHNILPQESGSGWMLLTSMPVQLNNFQPRASVLDALNLSSIDPASAINFKNTVVS